MPESESEIDLSNSADKEERNLPKIGNISALLTPTQLNDLRRSGLTDETIRRLRIRPAGHLEIEAIGLTGDASLQLPENLPYIIPYFQLDGTPAGHYRVKLLAPLSNPQRAGQKYAQPYNTPSVVYIPPGFLELFYKRPFVIFTEGEKKAAAAVQAGVPAIGLGGVDNWRNRTFEVATVSLAKGSTHEGREHIILKLQPGHPPEVVREMSSGAAKFLPEVVSLCRQHDKIIAICFDSDEDGDVKEEVQRASADLAFFLRIDQQVRTSRIRQLVLPSLPGEEKTGLDDFIASEGVEALIERLNFLLDAPPWKVYPRRPNIPNWIIRQLNRGRMSRWEIEKVVLSLIAELDARGRRLEAPGNTYYYFDEDSKVVMPATFVGAQEKLLMDANFGRFLYGKFGLRTRDQKVREGILDAYIAEEGREEVEPHRGLRVADKSIDYQLSDSSIARVTADGIEIVSNGSHGTLFLSDQVEDAQITQDDVDLYMKEWGRKRLPNWWRTIFQGLHITNIPGLEKDESIELISTLFYISPWLNRWRGTQLPLEIACAEAGSGKSSTYQLRLTILTGRPELKNVPNDIRDWYAAIASSPCMWVGDNVRFGTRDIRQRISDELCRLITEPEPQVVLRRLYTTSDTARIPVNTVFAVTSIYPPFASADIQQRSITISFEAIPEGEKVGSWVEDQLARFGKEGRKMWLLHHLDALHRFLKVAETQWNPHYKSYHRLANLEQCLSLMGSVVGAEHLTPGCLKRFALHASDVSDDSTMSGLIDFAAECAPGFRFSASEVVDWALQHTEYQDDIMLTNARRLGRYIQAHAADVSRRAGIEVYKKYSNRTEYKIEHPPVIESL